LMLSLFIQYFNMCAMNLLGQKTWCMKLLDRVLTHCVYALSMSLFGIQNSCPKLV
jgi:hypothetical protein